MAPRGRKKSKTSTPSPLPVHASQPLSLILTSEKRRGLYECDYCRTDLSQGPRICCAICPDFDLCLECFSNPNTEGNKASRGRVSGDVRHDHTHGYRVCDSSRFFMFPSLRGVERVPEMENSDRSTIDSPNAASEATAVLLVNGAVDEAVDAPMVDEEKEQAASPKVDEVIEHTEVPKIEEKEEQTDVVMTDVIAESADIGKIETDVTETEVKTEIKEDEVIEASAEKPAEDIEMKDADQGTEGVADVPKPTEDIADVPKPTEDIADVPKSTEDIADVPKPTEDIADVPKPKADEADSISEESISDSKSCHPTTISDEFVVTDDIRNMWTAEEDLRLLDAISTVGLGNWVDISEEVAGTSGLTNKTPKKCMERYLYDYLGKYGHILPQYTLVEVNEDESEENMYGKSAAESSDGDSSSSNSRKRMRSELSTSRHNSSISTLFKSMTNKEYAVVPTSTLPFYDSVWPDPYLPPIDIVKTGDDVGRDLSVRAEQAYVKASTVAASQAETQAIREDWTTNQLNKHGGPTVLPPRADDVSTMQGSDLAGFMPRRGDFDIEWDNDAEKLIQDMEFSSDDTEKDRALKIRVTEIYNARLSTREKRKQFLIDRGLLDYRKKHQEMNQLPSDERDLVNRMRLFARFHSPEEHEQLIQNLLKAKRLRKEIARLQMYRRMGFTSMVDAERFELDRNRREVHRVACEQREKEEKNAIDTSMGLGASEVGVQSAMSSMEVNASYLKQYKQNDRNKRHSIAKWPTDGATAGSGPEEKANPVVDGDKEAVEAPSEKASAVLIAALAEKAKEAFDVRKYPGFELLSKKELELCQKLELLPTLYNEAKTALIQESLDQGILDEASSNRRSIFKIDVQKRGDVIDFILQSGWVPALPKSVQARLAPS